MREKLIYRDPIKANVVYSLKQTRDGQWTIKRKKGNDRWRKVPGSGGPWRARYRAEEEMNEYVYENGLYEEMVYEHQ